MSLSERVAIWRADHPFVLPFSILGLLLSLGFVWVVHNESSADYSDYVGTVCCLSDSYYVESERSQPLRMMFVDLDNGSRVEVPIRYQQFFVHYRKNGRILVRHSENKRGPHPRYMAVRYLSAEGS